MNPATDRAKILLVDDHPANLVALEAILEPLHHETVSVTSGEEALRRILHEDFALILLDVMMPGLDGFQTAKLIKNRPRSAATPIIFLTAVGKDDDYIFKGYEIGAIDYLVKPFHPDLLRAKARALVDLYLRERQVEQQAERLRERERISSAARYQHLMDVVPQCLWVCAPDGEVTLVNRRLEEYTGQSLRAVRARGYRDFVHPDDQKTFDEAWTRSLSTLDSFSCQHRLRAADSSHRWFLASGVVERSPSGGPAAWVCTATDIDQQKLIEEGLRHLAEEQEAFVASASHELRTPLAAVKMQAQLLRRRLKGSLDENSERGLETISRQSDRMARLVQDMLDLTRLQTGRLSLEIGSFDLASNLLDWCARLQQTTTKHKVNLVAPASLVINGDAQRIEQVVINLINNAIRYSPAGGAIDVSLSVHPDDPLRVRFSVRDHGVGIPPEKQGAIFRRFGRAHGSAYGGLGLGLTIAHGIVEQHGGTISVASSGVEGEGTTFTVELAREAAVRLTSPSLTSEDGELPSTPSPPSALPPSSEELTTIDPTPVSVTPTITH